MNVDHFPWIEIIKQKSHHRCSDLNATACRRRRRCRCRCYYCCLTPFVSPLFLLFKFIVYVYNNEWAMKMKTHNNTLTRTQNTHTHHTHASHIYCKETMYRRTKFRREKKKSTTSIAKQKYSYCSKLTQREAKDI